MDYWTLTASTLSLILLIAHVIGGGREVHQPMLSSDMSQVNKAYASVIWHMITATLAVGSAALFWTGLGRGGEMAMIIAVQYLAFAGLFLFYGALRLKSVWVMPQWTAFLLISVLATIGMWSAQ